MPEPKQAVLSSALSLSANVKTETAKIDVTAGPSAVAALVDITQHTDPAQIMTLELWHSYDGGLTWVLESRAARGGDAQNLDLNGKPASHAAFVTQFSESLDGGLTFVPRKLPPFKAMVKITVTKSTLATGAILKWN